MAKKKPSQLDRIEKVLTQVHGQNIALRKFVDAILDESRAHHKDHTMPIPLPYTTSEAPPPTPESWVPKVDQMVVVIPATLEYLKQGEVCHVKLIDANGDAWVQSTAPSYGDGHWCVAVEDIRPATPEEITRYEQEQVTELQEGDACEVTPEQRAQIYALLSDAGAGKCYDRDANPSDRALVWRGYAQGPMQSHRYTGTIRILPYRCLPFDLFLKRARGTAARLKQEAEEAEAKKPIAFGTRVMTPRGEGLYWLHNSNGTHAVTYANGSASYSRSEFTILP